MEAALLSNIFITVSDDLFIRARVYFGKYMNIGRAEGNGFPVSERQWRYLSGEFNDSIQLDDAINITHTFSMNKKAVKKGDEIALKNKDSELRLTRTEWSSLMNVKSEVNELFNKFLVYTPTVPNSGNNGNNNAGGGVNGAGAGAALNNVGGAGAAGVNQQLPVVGFGQGAAAAAAVAAGASNNGAAEQPLAVGIVGIQPLGPQYTFVLQQIIEAQNNASPSYKRLLANRMCDGEIHLLVLAKLIRSLLDPEVRRLSCHGCAIDHPSQKEHMNPGHLDDEIEVVAGWMRKSVNADFLKNAIRCMGQRLGAPIGDCTGDLAFDQVVNVANENYDTFCLPCKLMIPLYLDLISNMGF